MDRAARKARDLALYEQLVKSSGGYTKLAKRLGISLTTLHGWKRRNNVPNWRVAHMLDLAKIDGLRVGAVPRGTRKRAA